MSTRREVLRLMVGIPVVALGADLTGLIPEEILPGADVDPNFKLVADRFDAKMLQLGNPPLARHRSTVINEVLELINDPCLITQFENAHKYSDADFAKNVLRIMDDYLTCTVQAMANPAFITRGPWMRPSEVEALPEA